MPRVRRAVDDHGDPRALLVIGVLLPIRRAGGRPPDGEIGVDAARATGGAGGAGGWVWPAGRASCSVPARPTHPQRTRCQAMIVVTRPAPTVRPPSRIANFNPSSIAIGWINSTDISVLSPGITISTPSGNVTDPVTSVVRK